MRASVKIGILLLAHSAEGFLPRPPQSTRLAKRETLRLRSPQQRVTGVRPPGPKCMASTTLSVAAETTSGVSGCMTGEISAGRPVQPGPHVKVGGRTANLVGLYFTAVCFAWALVIFPTLLIPAWSWCLFFDRRRRRAVDWVVHLWAKIVMYSCFFRPRVEGLENLKAELGGGKGLLVVPNHTSFLDIFALSGFLPVPLKYVSKVEILRIPLIGWSMRMAKHIAIRRTDRKSQMQTFKDTVESLEAGNTVVTFAEGTRSSDGCLRNFKKGPFKMSAKAGVSIVPVSICDIYRWMPSKALLPLGFPGRSVTIKVHPAVNTADRPEDEVLKEVFAAIDEGLPAFQKSKSG